MLRNTTTDDDTNVTRNTNIKQKMPLTAILFLITSLSITSASNLNVLLVIVDDLRPALGCYNDPKAFTPNMDRLAERSVLFDKAYAQQALCAPSRNSLLTSRRPDTLGLYDFYSYWRKVAGNFTTLPQHFKSNGYTTASLGKVFHPGASSNGNDDSPYSWSEKPFHPQTDRYKDAPVCGTRSSSPASNLVCPVRVSSMPNSTLPDIETLNAAKAFLSGNRREPFFLAVGFQKPHIPLKYPRRFLKYHPLTKFSVPKNYEWPLNVSSVAYNPWTDLRRRSDVEKLGLECPWEKIPRWSLGEHAEWAKYSNYEVALRVPLLISIPNITFRVNDKFESSDYCRLQSMIVQEPVELLDIFPTVAELANVKISTCPNEISHSRISDLCTEGSSLVPLIKAALTCKSVPWKIGAISQYPRPGLQPSCKPSSDEPRLREIRIMGYTLRTLRYRYTAWVGFSPITKTPDWREIFAEEMYDHKIDQEENINVAYSKRFEREKSELKQTLMTGRTAR
ncbi:iduronate 2-sulfatase isoform X2 [Nasonia vitripennis]|uniref:Sulfatase N-terminal domain-containing protein n=1 Tax=Nasonia vitripennis TaxID=7425 RepID=A0A7M7Q855_NASVI|nr:iduronate 2-sulfatase isoform X2 [Nasonia vitripennis]